MYQPAACALKQQNKWCNTLPPYPPPANALEGRITADTGRGYQGISWLLSPLPTLDCGSGVVQQVAALPVKKLRGCPATGEKTIRKEHLPIFRRLKTKHHLLKTVIA